MEELTHLSCSLPNLPPRLSRRYHAQAAPQQYASQHGVFGHPNPGFLNSVHNPRGGGEAERLSRIAAEEEAWHAKLKGDCKYMMSMLKQVSSSCAFLSHRPSPRAPSGLRSRPPSLLAPSSLPPSLPPRL